MRKCRNAAEPPKKSNERNAGSQGSQQVFCRDPWVFSSFFRGGIVEIREIGYDEREDRKNFRENIK